MIELAAQNLAIRLPLLLALFGLVVLGVLAFKQIERRPELQGRRLAWTGIILSIVSLIIAAGLYYDSWNRA